MAAGVPTDGDPAAVPGHVALVAAGGARWAEEHSADADAFGAEEHQALTRLVGAAGDLGIGWLTVQVPDPVPGRRDPGRLAEGLGAGSCVRVLGGHGLVTLAGHPAGPVLGRVTLTLVEDYGGRAEIVDAVAALAADGVAPADVDERSLAARLYAPDMPDPDLVVVAGGDHHVPDLLVWEVAYSELVILEDPWPDLGPTHLVEAVARYRQRDRRYGGLAAQGGGRR